MLLQLDTKCGWFYPVADSNSGGWTWVTTDLYLTDFNFKYISSKFNDLFCKIHNFHGFFSGGWFQLPVTQDLCGASRNLEKFEEALRSIKKLAATESICSSWFELRRLIRDLLQEFRPRGCWWWHKGTYISIVKKCRGTNPDYGPWKKVETWDTIW